MAEQIRSWMTTLALTGLAVAGLLLATGDAGSLPQAHAEGAAKTICLQMDNHDARRLEVAIDEMRARGIQQVTVSRNNVGFVACGW